MIDIFRKINGVETVIASVSNKNASHKQVIMGADEVSVGIVVSQVLDVKDGDFIYHNLIKYTCNRDAEYTKFSSVNYQYNLLFEHPLYRLLDKLLTYQLTGSAVFTLTGKLVDFVDAVCWNMNYHVTNNPRGIDSGWTRGSVVDTDYLTLTFGSVSCRDAITQMATAFNAEFYFSADGKTINFVDHIENETGLVFVQGRGNGLYSVSQQNVDTKDTITRVYPVGGNQNVPNAYADENGNLKLPELYLQNTTEYSRIVEKRVVFEDIFPHFIGTVESVAGTNNVEILCSDIDFDLNEIAVGDNARINFLTGALMGISFQFQYDHDLKKVTLIPQNDDTALINDDGTTPQVPRPARKAAVTDKFNFTGVVMPVQYVNSAITKLRDKGTNWINFYSRKRVKFGLDIDYRWMRGKQQLHPGDLVTIQIPERGIDKTIRISDIQTSLYDGRLSATVSNYRDENWQKKVEGAISSLQSTVSGGGIGGSGVDILERYDARPSSDRNVMSSLRSEKNFLRKDASDTASEHISFDKGLDALGFVQDKFAGSGAGIYEDELGNSVIEVDKLNVRKEAWFNEVVINQIRFQGGIVVYSAATLEVLSVTDGGSYLQVHFDTKDGQLANQFAVDDQIRCQRFSGGNVIKYYMSRVTNIGADYIRLSKSDIDGTLNVEVGDAIVQFGNRTNTARQSLIEVNVLDGGKQTFYQGVNSYNLTNKNYLELGRVLVDDQWKNMIRSYGGVYLGNRDLSSFIQYNEVTGKVEIKASVEFLGIDGNYKTVDQAIGEVEIGNRNYLLGSKIDNIDGWYAAGGEVVLVSDAKFGAVVEYTRLSGGGDFQKSFTIDVNSLKNTNVVYYAIAKDVNGTGGWNFGGWTQTYHALNNGCEFIDLGDGWKLYYKVLNEPQLGDGGVFGLNSIGGKWRFHSFGVCKGNKPPTDWTEAPEDVAADILAAKTAGEDAQTSANIANQAVGALSGYVDGSFKDGVIDSSEAKAIEKYINSVDTEYDNAINSYNVVYANGYLDGTPKLNLLNAKVTLAGAKNSLISAINTVIADGKTTASEKAAVDTSYALYKSAFGSYSTSLENANKAIQQKLDSISTDKVNSIEIGGVNLINNSLINESSNLYGFASRWVQVEAGNTYTLSANGNTSNAVNGKKLHIYIYKIDWSWAKWIEITETENTTKSVTFSVTETVGLVVDSYYYDASEPRTGSVHVNWYQLEKGNKATDWKPSKADTDAAISNAQQAAEDAAEDAAFAIQEANAANTAIIAISSDGVLSANEKGGELGRWNTIIAEKGGIINQAISFGMTNGIGSTRLAFTTAFTNLANYLNGGITWPSGTPSWLANLTTNTTIVGGGSSYRTKWEAYYTARTNILNEIAVKAKDIAISTAATDATSKAGTAQTNAINAAFEYGSGLNVFPQAEFANGLDDWYYGYSYSALNVVKKGINFTSDWSLLGNLNKANNQGLNTAYLKHGVWADEDVHYAYLESQRFAVQGGKKYIASIYAGNHRAIYVMIYIEFYNSAGTWLGWSGDQSTCFCQNYEAAGGQNINGYKRIYTAVVAPQDSVKASVVIRKYGTVEGETDSYAFFARPMVEQVHEITTKPGVWQPYSSGAEVADAKARAIEAKATADAQAYLKAAIAQVTEVNGGLVLAAALCARDINGNVTAYLNGLTQKPYAVAAGVQNWGTGTESARSWIDFIGNAKFGNLRIGTNGDGTTWIEDAAGITRTEFSIKNIPTLASLLAASGQDDTVNNVANDLANSTTYILPNSIDVENDNSELTVTGTIMAEANIDNPDDAASMKIEVKLIKADNSTYAGIKFVQALVETGFSDSQQATFSVKLTGVPAGNYRLKVGTIAFTWGTGTAWAYISATTMRAQYAFDKRAMLFGADGLSLFWDAYKYFHIKSGAFTYRGALDIPAGLGGGKVASGGGLSYAWGAKPPTGCSGSTTKTITHDIGDTDYTLMVTMTSNNTYYITGRSSSQIQVVTAGSFEFVFLRIK